MLVVRWNCLRPTHSSPSSVSAGRSSMNQSGAKNLLPSRDTNASPSQYARIPSSFSLIHQPVGSWLFSHLCASSTGGAAPPVVTPVDALPCCALGAFGAVGAVSATPIRAVSAASPRYARRCLHVRLSICVLWLRHAGQLHEYTTPMRLSV